MAGLRLRLIAVRFTSRQPAKHTVILKSDKEISIILSVQCFCQFPRVPPPAPGLTDKEINDIIPFLTQYR